MNKYILYIISGMLLLTAVILPIIFCTGEDFIHVVDHISFLLAAVCAILTLWIAILLYDKYGVDKKIVDKNIQIVFDIVEELKRTNLYAEGKNSSGSYVMRINFWTTDISESDMLNRYMNDKAYFSISYVNAFDRLNELSRDPFVPKSIADSIKLIQMYFLPEIEPNEIEGRYVEISTNMDPFETRIGKLNGKDITLGEYIRSFQAIKRSVKLWLLEHNVEKASLNF